jgi:hypothetical protein
MTLKYLAFVISGSLMALLVASFFLQISIEPDLVAFIMFFGALVGEFAHARLFPNDGWRLTAAEVIALAKQVAAENGWMWLGPGVVRKEYLLTRLIFAAGGSVWRVKSHYGFGCNVEVLIRDRDARVLFKGFDPR